MGRSADAATSLERIAKIAQHQSYGATISSASMRRRCSCREVVKVKCSQKSSSSDDSVAVLRFCRAATTLSDHASHFPWTRTRVVPVLVRVVGGEI